MSEIITYSDIEKVKTKEELTDSLYNYYGFITREYIEYMDSLLNLEVSYLDRSVNDEVKYLLGELKLFREIVKYNIYYDVLRMIKDDSRIIVAKSNDSHLDGLDLEVQGNRAFNFSYRQNPLKKEIIPGYRSPYVGEINLYSTVIEPSIIDKEYEKLKKELLEEENKINPYLFVDGKYADSKVSTWDFEHREQLDRIKNKMNMLRTSGLLDAEDYETIEIVNEFYKRFMKRFGLKENEFKLDSNETNVTYKRRVKRIPNLDVKTHTYYVS